MAWGLLLGLGLLQLPVSGAENGNGTDDIVQRIRRQSMENAKIRNRVTNLGTELADLQRLIDQSGVIDQDFREKFGVILECVEVTGNQALVNSMRGLLSSIDDPESRAKHLAEVVREYEMAAAGMQKAVKIAKQNTSRAAILQRLTQIIGDLSLLREDTFASGRSELEGVAVSRTARNELSGKQYISTERIARLSKDAGDSAETIEAAAEIAGALSEVAGTGRQTTSQIDEGNLLEAVKRQEQMLERLDQIKRMLNPEGEKSNNEAMAQDLEKVKKLEELMKDIADQAEKLTDFEDKFEGDKEELADNKEYNELKGDQNELLARAQELAQDMQGEAAEKMEKAVEDLQQANSELQEGKTEEAVEKNQDAQQAMQEAAEQQLAQAQQQQQQQQQDQQAQDQQQQQQQQDPQMAQAQDQKPQQEQQQQPPKPGEPQETDKPMEEPNIMANAYKEGTPAGESFWSGAEGEKNKRSMMQGMNEKAPPEFEGMARDYFASLSAAINE